jgi:hypothetical protein
VSSQPLTRVSLRERCAPLHVLVLAAEPAQVGVAVLEGTACCQW